MNTLWSGLLANTAIVALFVSIWTQSEIFGRNHSERVRRIGFGALFGIGTIVAMHVPFELITGIFIDLRWTLIALSAFFGGPISGILTALLAILFRIYVGGMGALAGSVGIIIAAVTGLCGYRLCRGRAIGVIDLTVLATAVALGGMLGFLALPQSVWMTIIVPVGVPVVTLVFLATLISGLAMTTELKRRAATRANLVYRAVIEALPDCLNAKDKNGRFIIANPATADLMHAADANGLIGKTDFDFYPQHIATAFRADEDTVIASGIAATIEQSVQHRDGTSGWLSTLKAPLRSASGELLGIITHNRDITERKRLKETLARSERRLSDALEQMADGLVKFDRTGRIEFCNAQYRALFSKTADLRVPGQSIREILRAGFHRGEEMGVTADGLEAFINAVVQLLSVKGVRQIELEDGRWIEARTKPTADGSLVVYSDVTAAKHSEKQLTEINQQLELLANTDGLTGLINRRAFDLTLEAEVLRAGRGDTSLALMMIDVDRFKAYNDTYGHPAGDEALRAIANGLKATIRRPSDRAARYGGEELCAILHATSREGAIQLAEAFRAAVHALDIPHTGSEKGRVTVSIGIATFEDATSMAASMGDVGKTTIVRLADEALYAAKATGRNRVHAWEPRPLEVSRKDRKVSAS